MNVEENWHALETIQCLEKLKTSLQGLTQEEAAERLKRYGFNELAAVGKVSPLITFLRQFKSILILILICATVISLVTGHGVDALVIFVIVLVSALLGFTQEYRAERALETLKKMLSPTAALIRDGKEVKIPTREIVPGDILVLREGDKVPADARLIEVINLQTNEASLTGESMPVSKETTVLSADVHVPDRKNMVFSGTEVISGKGKAVVVATGMNTEFGKIAKQVTVVVKEETPLEKRTKELGKWLGIVALFISASVLVLGIFKGMEPLKVILFSIALAVAAVPEALPAVVTGSLAIGMYKMARSNALVRKMPAVETLGAVTVICSDKTGTLTRGEMTVRRIYVGKTMINVSGAGYEPKGEFQTEDESILKSEIFSLLMKGSILCNDSELSLEGGQWRIKGDPTEGALLVAAAKAGFQQNEIRTRYPRVGELPFSSERKRMTTVHLTPDGDKIVYVKGAPEIVLDKCTHVYESKMVEKLTEKRRKQILEVNEEMAKDALRVLGVAYKKIPADLTNFDEETLDKNLVFLGLLGMMDPPREEAKRAVEVCKQIKIKTVMITGDHKLTAVAIAKEMGIFQEGDIVLTGEDLEKMTDEELKNVVEKVSVYARVSPTHKLKIVQALKAKGHVVAMTGDGVNDAPALKHADIGVAMGITGTDVAKEASDLVLLDDNFATIVKAIELGRWIYDNIKKYLTYLLQANLVEIAVLSVGFLLYPDVLPLLPVQILYINLATDGLPAIALGVSPPDPDIMKRPPRDPKETVFTKDVKSFLSLAVLIEVPLLLWVFLSSLTQSEQIAQTRLFLVLVFFELVIALNCRSLKHTLIEAPPHKLLLLAVIWEALLITALVNIPVTRQALGVTQFGLFEVELIAGLSLITILSIEGIKRLLQPKSKN
ncbi:MAG: cation-translocating P-type ATPase [Nitrososphaerota archaeon]|nr:cation-translocating P-type ATPase [Candidatus Bathyarchaeota archaeon]MDW8022461.1 cation-translocating P-type ATPase [Nitrososphaerota archaeon]